MKSIYLPHHDPALEEKILSSITGEVILRVVRGTSKVTGQPTAMVFRPKAKRPHGNYRFQTVDQQEAYIAEQVKIAREHEDRILAKRAVQKKFRHGYEVGDLLSGSWGYEQTNVELYQVVKTSEKQITVRELDSKIVSGDFWSGQVVPLRDQFTGPEVTRTVQPITWNHNPGKGYIRIGHSITLSESAWDEKHSFSSYG
jgi:hypothetical protein